MNRRGFTLAELLVALVILGVVCAAIYKVLVGNQRTYQAQTQKIDLQQNIRAAMAILPAELRVLDAADGDIVAMSSDSIRIRAMRQMAIVCDTPALGGALTARQLTVRNGMAYGVRTFNNTTDSLLLYYEGNEAVRTDDSWLIGKITAVAALACPGVGGPAGTRLTVDFKPVVAPQVNKTGAIPIGVPVWSFETVTYKLYQLSGAWYLGLRDNNGISPVVGPLTGATGLAFTYYDAAGAVTAVPANVVQIEIRLRAQTAQAIQLPAGGRVTPVDSLVTRVALRNNRRF